MKLQMIWRARKLPLEGQAKSSIFCSDTSGKNNMAFVQKDNNEYNNSNPDNLFDVTYLQYNNYLRRLQWENKNRQHW